VTVTLASIRHRTSRFLSATVLFVTIVVAALVLVPRLTGHEMYVITTGSMTGTADAGSLVIARAVPTAELAIGDVITYLPPPATGIDHPVTHRIASIAPDAYGLPTFTTKGDANGQVDPWTFQLDQPLQARMRVAVGWLGYPVLWLADRTTRVIAIGVPALAVALLAARDLVHALRRDGVATPAAVRDVAAPSPVLVIDLDAAPVTAAARR
jgi:signal peptidase I